MSRVRRVRGPSLAGDWACCRVALMGRQVIFDRGGLIFLPPLFAGQAAGGGSPRPALEREALTLTHEAPG